MAGHFIERVEFGVAFAPIVRSSIGARGKAPLNDPLAREEAAAPRGVVVGIGIGRARTAKRRVR
jgi:hypothetical protein